MASKMIKSMSKWTWRLVMILLLAASIWVFVIWMMSYFQAEWYQSQASYEKPWRPGAAIRGYTYSFDSGGVCFERIRWDLPTPMTDAELDAATVHDAYAGKGKPSGYPKGHQFQSGYPLHVNWLGFGYLKLPPEPDHDTLTRTFTIFPFWAVVAALGLLPGMWLAVKLFQFARRKGRDKVPQ